VYLEQTGELTTVCTAFFTFVRADSHPVEPVHPSTPEEQKYYDGALDRRQMRLARRVLDQNHKVSLPSPSTSASTIEEGGDSSATVIPLLADSSHGWKYCRESIVEMTHLVFPSHANTAGITFGGQIMAWMVSTCIHSFIRTLHSITHCTHSSSSSSSVQEMAASISACRHARATCINISVDSLHFLKPSKVGEAIIIKSQVNRVFGYYMEVGITVEVEDLLVCEPPPPPAMLVR